MARHQLQRLMAIAIPFAVAMVLIPAVPDVDLWGHVRFGGDIVRARAIPALDLYSFTADRAWINHEWLSEVVMYGAYTAAGSAGLTLLRLALIALTLALVAWTASREGVPPARIHILVAFVALLTYPRTEHIRPQLFSILLFSALLFLMRAYERVPRAVAPVVPVAPAVPVAPVAVAPVAPVALVALVPPLMALWVNVHGGWVVGMGIFGLWAAAVALRPSSSWLTRGYLFLVVVAALAATLLNPYGIRMWSFLWDTLGVRRADITEWLPITRVQAGVAVMWYATAVAALSAIPRRPGMVPILLVVTLGLLSFRVSRLDAFFCVGVFTLMAPQLGRATQLAPVPRALPARRFPGLGTAISVDAMLVGLAVLCAMVLRRNAIAEIDLSSAYWLPERSVVHYLTAHQVRGRMLTYFDWGEYAIWHLAPEVKVSMDGRRETVYSDQPIEGHLAVYQGRPGALDYIRRVNPDYVWLPKSLPVVSELQASGEWTTTFEGPTSAVLARHPEPEPLEWKRPAAESQRGSGRRFPGP
jgi:hypothetical protein